MSIPVRIVAVLALLVGLVMGYGAWAKHHQGLGYQRAVAEYTAQALQATEAARTKELAMQAKITKANDEARKRETKLQADAAALRNTADGLRQQVTAIRSSLPGLTRDAIERYADAASVVFGDCVREYQSVAGSADKHASDALMLRDAWPVN